MNKNDFEDDGRVVADMSSTQQRSWYENFSRRDRKSNSVPRNTLGPEVEMTKQEARKFMFTAVLTGLFVASIFIVVFFVFIWFCVNIWFQ